jgi:hypothetical protein
LENPPKGAPFGNRRLCLKKLKALPEKNSRLCPEKPKAVVDADAFVRQWDFKSSRPLMGAGQSAAGFQGQRPWASLWLKGSHGNNRFDQRSCARGTTVEKTKRLFPWVP